MSQAPYPTSGRQPASSDSLAFIDQFRQRHGRALRVLHIGNIANNAYTNARIQRRFGIHAEVVCYDYYHIMGCPEWEDAEFEVSVDSFYPDWWKTSLGGWSRPAWFAQGPIDLCIDYLLARNSGDPQAILEHWDRLQSNYRSILATRATGASEASELKPLARLASRVPPRMRERLRTIRSRLRRAPAIGGIADATSGTSPSPTSMIDTPSAEPVGGTRSIEQCRAFGLATAEAISANHTGYDPSAVLNAMSFARDVATKFAPLLNRYDVIQGYSTDGFIPFSNGFTNYTAYEHGTLRDIPFEKGYNGILANYAYKNAAFSFVTNCDVLPSAERMGLDRKRVICLPHAFDDTRISNFLRARAPSVRRSDKTVFFSPSRQHWRTEPQSMQKGNDLFILAAARALKINPNFEIHFVRWGMDIGASERLIADVGLEDHVRWLEPLRKKDLWEAYCTADAVVDQFAIPAIGGVCFEAMALGTRVITRIDPDVMVSFFGAAPPCLSAHSIESCFERVMEVLNDPHDVHGSGAAAARWMQNYHSSERILALQTAAYRAIVEGRPAA